MTDKITDSQPTDAPPPLIFEWASYHKGMGLLCTTSLEYRTYVQNIIDEIVVANHRFRAWSREELRHEHIALLINTRHRERSSHDLYVMIMRANPISTEDLQVESCDLRSTETGERLLRLRISCEAFRALKERGGMIQLGIHQYPAYYKGKPLKDAEDL